MPASADRILESLPPTFAALPRPTVLAAFSDAFGNELTGAENALAAVMFAHWADHADAGADTIRDLASIAALYGLAPRDDETVEGFRAHVKRYVRTFLEGTTTVRGICRIVAEALGIAIADDRLDTWWTRPDPLLTTVDAAADDAATLLFGVPEMLVRGRAAQPAELAGTVDLSAPVDLRGGSVLSVAVDGGAPVTIDLAAHLDPAAAGLDAIAAALGTVAGLAAVARGNRLVLRSASSGAASALELADVAGDAAPALLGIAPRSYAGRGATRAQVTGSAALPSASDLSVLRYLRLTIDGNRSYEIDCAGANPAATSPAEIVAAIAAEAGPGVASLDGGRLVLASPSLGLAGTIAVLVPTAGDATALLLGDAARYARGTDGAAARVSGQADLSAGVDLSGRANLQLAVDAFAPVIVSCAGANPAKTSAGEIALAINAAFGVAVAAQNGSTVTLTSRVDGPGGSIRLLTAPSGDALDLIFGFAPRRASGSGASAAAFAGGADLSNGVDLRALNRVQIALDDAAPAIVDLAAAGLARADASPHAIAAAINAVLEAPVASTDGVHLGLHSVAPGEQGSVALVPIETQRARPFVSRAFSLDEASNTVLGTFAASASGAAATGAVLGSVELHDGLDLRTARYLRVSIDGGTPHDVDCASRSPRPRSVLLSEIAAAIDAAFAPQALASVAGDRLVLSSPTQGASSAVTLLPGGGDGAQAVFGSGPVTAKGRAAARVIFTGLADLSRRVDLSAARAVKLAIDGAAPVEIACAGADPARTAPLEIVAAINTALGGTFAGTDGAHVRLSSAVAGSTGSVALLAPAAADATRAIFGIPPGRTYRGEDAGAAMLASAHDLPAALDLRATPFVRVAVDAGAPVLVDCRGADPARTTPAEVAAKIGAALPTGSGVAALQGSRVIVTAASAGAGSRVDLLEAADGDASALLFGDASAQHGRDAVPATLTGSVALSAPVDLSLRPVLRLAVDGGRAVDVDVSGAAPDRTFGDEIVAAIGAALPGVASLDAQGRLVLTSPTAGERSSLAVLPLRPLEVIEYPPGAMTFGPQTLADAGTFTLDNDGASETAVAFDVTAPGGLAGVDLMNVTTGYRVRVEGAIRPGGTLRVAADAAGRVGAIAVDASGRSTALAAEQIAATPLAVTAVVPFAGARPLGTSAFGPPALALVDPLASTVVVLEARGAPTHLRTMVRVVAAGVSAASAPPGPEPGTLELVGRLRAADGALVDGNDATIARVRAAAGAEFAPFDGRVVAVRGTWYPAGADSLLAVTAIAQLFDVTVDATPYDAVALDARAGARSLRARIDAGPGRAVAARDVRAADALALPRGRSRWMVQQCDGPRFGGTLFDAERFAGKPCSAQGVFGVSRFADDDTGDRALYAPAPHPAPLTVRASWTAHRPGAFAVNLPADLPARFGARFNEARFAAKDGAGEEYEGVVLDPPDDPDYIVTVLRRSKLVRASAVARAPLGWDAQRLPFHSPRTRAPNGGRAGRASAMYVYDPEVPGVFEIAAASNGAWGDELAISVRYGGPARYDVTVSYAAARFENARAIAYAGSVSAGADPLPALVAPIIAPQPVGVVQAKAAGIRADVTRDRT